MPTTFNVISLGTGPIIDPTEGNTDAENAAALVGNTYGDLFDPLWEKVQSLSPAGTGFGGGTNTAYDQDNNLASEQFSLDGGPAQTFDASVVYNATITYVDGTTATITAVVFQDTAGNLYLAPEFSANTDQAALEAGPIRSLTLDSLNSSVFSGMTGTRETSNYAVCFVKGTSIATPGGAARVETLKPGDLVMTMDSGPQPIRWIGGRCTPAVGAMMPVRIAAGALGAGLPETDLLVSRQHRLLVDSKVAARMTGSSQVLVPAHYLIGLPGITAASDIGFLTYWHFMCDRHEIVFADGAPAETLHLGREARKSMPPEAIAEIEALFPQLAGKNTPGHARPLPRQPQNKRLADRLRRNKQPVLNWGCAT